MAGSLSGSRRAPEDMCVVRIANGERAESNAKRLNSGTWTEAGQTDIGYVP